MQLIIKCKHFIYKKWALYLYEVFFGSSYQDVLGINCAMSTVVEWYNMNLMNDWLIN